MGQTSFGTLLASVYTLFATISGGTDWSDVAEPLGTLHWTNLALFVFFVAFIYFAVLNVVTGVFCQSAIESAAHDRDMVTEQQLRSRERYVTELISLFKELDT